jgi:hypothetical protein
MRGAVLQQSLSSQLEVHMADNPENAAETQSHGASNGEAITSGAQFWVHISPQHNTEHWVEQWEVTFELDDWSGTITSANPQEILQTPGLSGIFNVAVIASGPNMHQKILTPLTDSRQQIRCNANCAAMVGIIAAADGNDAHYWTVWDALCN